MKNAARLAELERICRERDLTDAEQREVMLLARRERQNKARVRQWRTDPAYRQHKLATAAARRASRQAMEAAE